MSEARDLYKVLQVDPEADLDIIQTVYRRLAQKFHPDRNGGSAAAAARMIELNAAWEVLRDPARRAAYDRERAARAEAATRVRRQHGPATSGHPSGPASAAAGPSPASPPPGARPAAPGSTPRPTARATGWRATTGSGGETGAHWSSARSAYGGGYDASMRAPDGHGAAGPPPGNPEGSVLTFGRYAGWSLGEVARVDLEFLEWLERSPSGRQYREEVDVLLRRAGRRGGPGQEGPRSGLFRR